MPSYPKMSWEDLQSCIDALKYQAKTEADQTVAPFKRTPESFPQWDLAKRLQDRLDTHKAKHVPHMRKKWEW